MARGRPAFRFLRLARDGGASGRAARRYLRTETREGPRGKTGGGAEGNDNGPDDLWLGRQKQGRRANSDYGCDAIDRGGIGAKETGARQSNCHTGAEPRAGDKSRGIACRKCERFASGQPERIAGCDSKHHTQTNFSCRSSFRKPQSARGRDQPATGAARYSTWSECEPGRFGAFGSRQSASKSFTSAIAYRTRNTVARSRQNAMSPPLSK